MEYLLYNPIRNYFLELGYDIKSEILNCDIAIFKDDELTIIEMKKTFSLKLVYQAIDRLKYTKSVYVAILSPKRQDKNMLKLLRKLEIGLIYVSTQTGRIDFVLHPTSEQKNNKSKRRMMEEFSKRKSENIGGVNKRKIMTSYRERATKIALTLLHNGETKVKVLVDDFGCDKSSQSILYKNYYGWFIRTGRGVYNISEKGLSDLQDDFYKDIVSFYENNYSKIPLKQ